MILLDNYGIAIFLGILTFLSPILLFVLAEYLSDKKPKLAKIILIIACILFLIGLGMCSGII